MQRLPALWRDVPCWSTAELVRSPCHAAGVPGTALPGGFQQFNCIVNTMLSLLGATVVTFIASAAVHNKFDDMVRPVAQCRNRQCSIQCCAGFWTCSEPVLANKPQCHRCQSVRRASRKFADESLQEPELLHGFWCAPASPYSAMLPRPRVIVQVHIQNATLAGGVAIGSAANLMVSPGGALAVGVAAGLLSTCGYAYLMPRLEVAIGLRDTCGVHNLHGMPGVLGGLVTALVAVASPEANAPVMKFAGRTQARGDAERVHTFEQFCLKADSNRSQTLCYIGTKWCYTCLQVAGVP